MNGLDYTEHSERYIPNKDILKWNQSIYFNFYDPVAKLGGFIRCGIMENMDETNMFAIIFKDGKPLYTRSNMNLPYTDQRMDPCLEVAGVRFETVKSLQTARVSLEDRDFGFDLVWDLIAPMTDSIAMTRTGSDAIAKELCYVHLEGHCTVNGTVRLRGGETVAITARGFRDISVGPRNWDGVLHYRLAWPHFENGVAIVAVHALAEQGDAYQTILFDGSEWLSITKVDETITYEADEMTFKSVHWKVWDSKDRLWEFTGKPLFRWMLPFDTFVMVEHMMEYTMSDGTIGHGLGEGGFRFPWSGNGN